jgi:hypothetical protein
MRPDPRSNRRCEDVTAALAAGEPADAEHLATCAACRARAALVGALGVASPARAAVATGAVPSTAGLRAAVRIRATRRAAIVAAALMLVVLGTFGLRARSVVPAPPVDLLAALDDADRAVAPAELPGEDLLALVDPLDDESFAPDPLLDALLGEGSL